MTVQDEVTPQIDEASPEADNQNSAQSSPIFQPGALRLVLILSALILGGIGQALLGGGHYRWAITPYVVAVLSMVLAVARTPLSTSYPGNHTQASSQDSLASRVAEVQGDIPRFMGWSERRWGFAVMTLAGLLLALSLFLFPKGPPNTLAWYSYGLSMTLVLLALPALESRWTPIALAIKNRWRVSFELRAILPWLGLGAILVFALMVRLYSLDTLPAGLWFDEAVNLSHANGIRNNPGETPVFVPPTTMPSMFLLLLAAMVELTGISITTARLVAVAVGIVGIVVMFLLVRFLLGSLMGLVAAFLVATMRWDINWSRAGMHGITTPLFAALTAYLTFRALRSTRYSDFGFAGAAMGLGMWFYAPFRVFPLVIILMVLYAFLSRREGRKRLVTNAAFLILMGVVFAAPVIQTAIVDSEEFFARTRTTSVFSLFPPGEALGQMFDSYGKHIAMFHIEGDPNPRHNLPNAPMLDFLSGMLLILGLGVAFARWRNLALIAMPVWIVVMMFPAVVTLPWEAPQSLRAIAIIPAVVVVITLAFSAVWTVGRSAPWGFIRRATPMVMLALLGAIAFMNINTYFGAQAQHPEVYAAFTTDETLMAPHMVEQQRRGYSLFVSRQFLYSMTASLLADNPQFERISAPANIPLDPEQTWKGASIYLEPREAGFYQVLKAYYPLGEFREVRPPAGGDALYYSAVISREELERHQGIVEIRTLQDGSEELGVRKETQAIWQLEADPEKIPFDMQWEGTLHIAEPGIYEFVLEGDTDAVVFLDSRRIVSLTQPSIKIEPALGLHELQVFGTVENPNGIMRLLWKPPNSESFEPVPVSNLYHGPIRPLGLSGRFFKDGEEVELADALRLTPTMDTFWYDPVLPEPYLGVWEGTLEIHERGEYLFKLSAAGQLKLFLDDNHVAETPEKDEVLELLTPGNHPIRIEYYSESPPSEFEIQWSPPERPLGPIPVELLSPAPEHMFRIVEGN